MNHLQNLKTGPGRVSAGRWIAMAIVLLLGSHARASVSLLLEQPYGKLGLIDPSGHSAVYFDHICAETPTKLRACRPDELGVVISRYDDVGGYDWVAMPLIPYLYGVERVDQIPLVIANKADEFRIRDAYRRAHLEGLVADRADGTAPDNNWYELVGSTFDRTIYGFRVKTTAEQDAKLIAYFNDSRNKQRYNGMFVNCADFVRTTINRIYPHAIRRNFLADWGMTSPKSTARALAHYSSKHPETEYSTFVIPQLPGLRRSREACTGAECMVKQYGIAVALVSPWTAGVEFATYLAFGRFAMPKTAPHLDVFALEAAAEARAAMPDGVVVAGSGGGIPPVSGAIGGAPARPGGMAFVVGRE